MRNQTNNHPDELMLHAYLDNELPHSIIEELNDHINHCQECARTIKKIKKLFEQIERLPTIELSTDFSKAIVNTINTQYRVSPILKRTTRLQIIISIGFIIIILLFFSPDVIPNTFIDIGNLLVSGFEMLMISFTKFMDVFPSVLSNINSFEISIGDFSISEHLPTNFLITLSICSGILWFIGNRILLPYKSQINSQNGG